MTAFGGSAIQEAGWRLVSLAAMLGLAGCPATAPHAPGATGTVAGTGVRSAPTSAPSGTPATADMARQSVVADNQTEQTNRLRLLNHLQSQDMGLANLPEAQAYLNALLRRIQSMGPQPARFAQVLIRPRLSYNAATTPEGYIVVDLGWLKSIDNEAELAALLAHEYAHVVLDHMGTRNVVGAATHAATLLAAAYAKRTGSNNHLSVSLVQSGWSDVLMPNWSRPQEFEADLFSLETTQAMGYAYVPGVRAFLERIRSIERSAVRAANPLAAAKQPGQETTQASTEHPPIDERIARLQQIVSSKPRARPTAQAGQDGWQAVKGASEFVAGEQEYLLSDAYFQALNGGKGTEANRIARLIAQRPTPLRTGAAKAALAWAAPPQDLARRTALLQEAIMADDDSFLPYRLLAAIQRDQLRQYEAAAYTMTKAMARFESPPHLMPEALEFMRVTDERIEAMPPAQRPSLFQLQNKAQLLLLSVQCAMRPEVSDACAWASLNDRQKAAKLQADKSRQDALSNSADRRIQKLLK